MPYNDGKNMLSLTCSMRVSWNSLNHFDFRDFNPGGRWAERQVIHFLSPDIIPSVFNSAGAFTEDALKSGMMVEFELKGGDLLFEELTKAPAFATFYAEPVLKLFLFEKVTVGDRVKAMVPIENRAEVISLLVECLNNHIDKTHKAIVSARVDNFMLNSDPRLNELLSTEKRLFHMRHHLRMKEGKEVSGPSSSLEDLQTYSPADQVATSATLLLNKAAYLKKLDQVDMFNSSRYASLLRKCELKGGPPLCKCLLQGENCPLRIMVGDHRFTYKNNWKSDTSMDFNISFDLEKKSKLQATMLAHKAYSSDFKSILDVKHIWDNRDGPIDAMRAFLDLAGEDYNFLIEFRQFFQEHFTVSVHNQIRSYLYQRLLNKFSSPWDSRAKRNSEIEISKSHAKKVLQVLQIPMDEGEVFLRWGIIQNVLDDPAFLDCLIELGNDPFNVNYNCESLLHLAALNDRPRLLRHGITLFKTKGESVDVRNSEGETPFFMKASEAYLPYSRDAREILEDLLQAGADPLSACDHFKTCVHKGVSATGCAQKTLFELMFPKIICIEAYTYPKPYCYIPYTIIRWLR